MGRGRDDARRATSSVDAGGNCLRHAARTVGPSPRTAKPARRPGTTDHLSPLRPRPTGSSLKTSMVAIVHKWFLACVIAHSHFHPQEFQPSFAISKCGPVDKTYRY